jgi:sterol desaturase/sphingolipid hydroxylase (fatty acid hydroxylase superfamily)
MRALRWIVRYLGMPGLLAGAAWGTAVLLARGWNEGAVLGLMGTVVFAIVWALEQVVPYRPDWNPSDGQRWHDIGHTLFGTYLGGKLGNLATFWLGGMAAAWIADHTGGGLWPSGLPLVVQVVLVFALADLGRYVQHRLMHEIPFLWKFHVLHHSTDVLTVFKTSRNHIVERLFQQLFLFGPMLALGAGSDAILPFIVANSYLGVFDHSNVDFRLGPLEYVIMGPIAHRLHHSRDLREGNTNYGTALLIWDWLFGTYTNPVARSRPGQPLVCVGVEDDPTPRGFIGQIIQPVKKTP